MSEWIKNAVMTGAGDPPIAEMVTSKRERSLRLRGIRWTQASTIASSGGAIGACHLQFGGSSASLSTIVMGHGSSLTAPVVNQVIDPDGIIVAKCIRGTFGAGSSAALPLTVTIWGDYV